jgi:flagellar M-ring protein FliF
MADAPSKSPNPALAVLKQTKELWDKQPKGRRTLAVLIVLGVLGIVGISALLKKTESWTPVAEGMAPVDSAAVYSALIGRGINARMRDNLVEVEADDLGQARAIATMTASTAGLSSMEAQFKDVVIGRTNLAEQVAYKMGLEGELARNIIQTAHLSSAHVTIAFGKRNSIKDMDVPATASVTVMPQAGAMVPPAVVTGIRQLVAASVDGLDASKVVVIGPRGPLDGDEKNGDGNQDDLESKLSSKVKAFLETKVGVGKVAVVSTVDLDLSKIEQTQDIYDPTGSAVLSTAKTVDGSNPSQTQSPIGGVAGAQGNLAGSSGPTGAGAGSAVPGNGHLTETTNFNNSHVITHTTKPEQKIQKLHVAIFVDEDTGKDGKSVARKPEEVAMLKTFAHAAAGLDDARGDTLELTSVPFAPIELPVEPTPPKALLPVPVPVAIGGGVGVLVLLAVVIIFLKGRGKKGKTQALVLNRGRLAFPTPVAELERALDGEPANATQLASREMASLPPGRTAQERVMDVVRSDVERAAGVLTGWLAEAPAKGAK